jgi:hypothetical protein
VIYCDCSGILDRPVKPGDDSKPSMRLPSVGRPRIGLYDPFNLDEDSEGLVIGDPNKQWRVDNARHLTGLRLEFRPYTRWSESWDHDHCAACWTKFAEFEGADIQREGYATCDDYPKGACYEWVCSDCFNDLKDEMKWTGRR